MFFFVFVFILKMNLRIVGFEHMCLCSWCKSSILFEEWYNFKHWVLLRDPWNYLTVFDVYLFFSFSAFFLSAFWRFVRHSIADKSIHNLNEAVFFFYVFCFCDFSSYLWFFVVVALDVALFISFVYSRVRRWYSVDIYLRIG